LQAFGQSSNASVGGIVSDPSGANIPGVTIKATNQATGIVTTVISNDAGAYNLASLLPGTYKISAELPGFQTQTVSDVQLGNAAQVRLNFKMVVANLGYICGGNGCCARPDHLVIVLRLERCCHSRKFRTCPS
jgi:hypothetical protein